MALYEKKYWANLVGKLKLACTCEEHNGMLAHCWPQIDLVSTLVNFIPRYCYVVLWLTFLFSCEGCIKFPLIFKIVERKMGMFACKEASLDQARVLKIVVAKNSCS